MPVKPTGHQSARIDRYGIYEGYGDSAGEWRPTSRATSSAIRSAMGLPHRCAPSPNNDRVRILKVGERAYLSGDAELVLEDGMSLTVSGWLPPDLPVGYHRLYHAGREQPQCLIVSPGTCYLPENLRAWGWSVQVYALRSRGSWGIGDLGDLHRFACWSSSRTTASVLMINPLCATTPVLPQQPSPYYPSSRSFRNPLYLNVKDLPGARDDRQAIERLAAAGQALNTHRLIDRNAVYRLKMAAFERLWKRFRGDRAFERYRAEQGDALQQFAVFCTLAERHGSDWRRWPARLRDPCSAAVRRFATSCADRVRFHQWLQWLLDRQLSRVGRRLTLIADLPIGVDPGGADAWRWQGILAAAAHVGAPPDRFNTQGQDWGIRPFVPHRLRAAGYVPFIEGLRAAFRHAGGLRIDHVMGLFRLFWIPDGLPPGQGAYVAYPAEEMLAVLAIESQRARAFVVGEDLGTVERGVRRALAARRVLGYKVMWFERHRPNRYRRRTLASVTTHDLPTIAGVWSGQDVCLQRELGLSPPERDYDRMRRRLERITGLAGDTDVHAVISRVHQELAQGRSLLRVAGIDDTLGLHERPNVPGTTTGYPNWSLALPVPLENIPRHALAKAVSKAMTAGDRIPPPQARVRLHASRRRPAATVRPHVR